MISTIFGDNVLNDFDVFLIEDIDSIKYILKLTGTGPLQTKIRLYISMNGSEWIDAGTIFAKGNDLVYKTETQDLCYKYQKCVIEQLSGTNAKVSLTYQY